MKSTFNGSLEQTIRNICRQEIQSFFEDLLQSKLESKKPSAFESGEAVSINPMRGLRRKVAIRGRVTDPSKDKRLKANREAS